MVTLLLVGLVCAFANALYIWGLYAVSRYSIGPDFRFQPWDSMLLGWFAYRLRRYYIGKALINCPRCMGSVHTLYPWALLVYHLDFMHALWWLWPFYAIITVALITGTYGWIGKEIE